MSVLLRVAEAFVSQSRSSSTLVHCRAESGRYLHHWLGYGPQRPLQSGECCLLLASCCRGMSRLLRAIPTTPCKSLDGSCQAWLYMILVSVTLAVAAIPEGIPLCVTISLCLGP